MKRFIIRRILTLAVIAYVMVCVYVALIQRQMIYHPPEYSTAAVDAAAQSSRLERWKDASGNPIGMKRLSPKQPSDGQVMIVYGNGSCATSCAHYADQLQPAAALDVYILEYPGYADRPGKPSQKNLFQAADEAFQSLPTNQPTYLLGESLGTGVASHLAGTFSNKVAGVVLFAPYNSLTAVAQYHEPFLPVWLLLLDRYPSQDFLRSYLGPVGILVAGKDLTVPEKFGRRLYDSYQGPKQLWEFPSDNHGSVMGRPPDFWKEVIAFWKANSH